MTTPDTAPTPAEIADAHVVIRDFAEAFDAMEARVGGLAREGTAEIRELAGALAKIRPVVTGGRNRRERRRARSRRWRG